MERHHIIPKSEGGSDDPDNLVNLTAREHYIAHLLLARIYDDQKMWCAAQQMMNGNVGGKKFKFNSKLYEHARVTRNAIVSSNTKGKPKPERRGEKRTIETCRKISNALKGKPKLWLRGRCSNKAKETLAKHRNGNTFVRGKLWWNNGVSEQRAFECPDNGWLRGRLHKTGQSISRSKKVKKCHWYNNGKKSILATDCPDGFVLGRLVQ